MRRTLLLLAPLVAAALAFWVLRGERDGAGPEALPAAPDTGMAARPAGGLRGPGPEAPRLPPRAPRALFERALGTARADVSAAPEVESWPAPALGIEFVVVRAGTDEPVPRALVHWLPDEALSEAEESAYFTVGFDVDGLFHEHSRVFRADEEGRVRVPSGEGGATVMARGSGLWGVANWRDVVADGRLELHSDAPVRVRVVTEDGSPVAGIEVSLRFVFGDDALDLGRARTDERGEATLRHAAGLASLFEEPLHVGVGTALFEPVQAEVPEDPAGRTIVLTLPACGSLDVRLVTADGEPADVAAALWLDWFAPGEEEPLGSNALALFESGRALVHPVSLGLEFVPRVESLQANAMAEGERFGGPRSAGEVVERTIEVQPAPALVGRLLDPSGEPLRRERVRAVLNTRVLEDWRREARRMRTDEGGRLRLELDREPGVAGQRWLDLFLIDAVGDVALTSSVGLPARFELGETDLGDVRMTPPPVLVTGRVFDQTGRPVPAARVRVSTHLGANAGWEGARELDTITDLLGTFEVRGLTEASRLRVVAEHDRYLAEGAVEVGRGARDVSLYLHAAGRLVVDAVLEAGHSPRDLRARVEGPAGESSVQGFDDAGEASFERLPVGLAHVRVELTEEDSLLWEERCELAVDEPARLAVDLRGSFRTFEVRIVDDLGAPVRASVRRRVRPDEEFGPEVRADAEGVLRVATVHAALELEVASPGFRTARVTGVAGPERIVLDPGPAVRVRLVPGLPALLEGESVVVFLRGIDDPRALGWGVFDADGTAELRVQAPGTYSLRLHFNPSPAGEGQRVRSLVVPMEEEPAVTVPEEGGLEVEVDLASSALETLRE